MRGGVAGSRVGWYCGKPCEVVLREAVRGGIAGSHAGWRCGEPCGVVLREAVRGGPEGCDGRRAILHCSNGVIHEGFLAAILKFTP